MQYTISLNRAHKISERLRQYITDTAKGLRTSAAPVRVRSSQDADAQARAIARQGSFSAQLNVYGEATRALEALRNAIAKGNVAAGVDVLLTKQNRINQELVLAKELVSDASLDECVSFANVPMTPDTYATYNLAAVSQTDFATLTTCIRDLQTQLHAVSDEVSDANRATIVVELSEEHARIVGLVA